MLNLLPPGHTAGQAKSVCSNKKLSQAVPEKSMLKNA
jgi:hypothetical protein